MKFIMPDDETEKLKHHREQKSLRYSFVIYLDFENIFQNVDSCRDNPEREQTSTNKCMLDF